MSKLLLIPLTRQRAAPIGSRNMDSLWEHVRAFDILEPLEYGPFQKWSGPISSTYKKTLDEFKADPAAHYAVSRHLEQEKAVFAPWYTLLHNEFTNTPTRSGNAREGRIRIKDFVRLFLDFLIARQHAVMRLVVSHGFATAQELVVSARCNLTCGFS